MSATSLMARAVVMVARRCGAVLVRYPGLRVEVPCPVVFSGFGVGQNARDRFERAPTARGHRHAEDERVARLQNVQVHSPSLGSVSGGSTQTIEVRNIQF